MSLRKSLFAALLATSALASGAAVADVIVGGQPMLAEKNIVANAMNSADHTTLVAAVKAAGLVETLQGDGPFTVFAPVNAAFAALPAGTVEMLLEPAHKADLTKVLTYHVVAGKLTFEDLRKSIEKGGGMAELTTVSGGKLWARMNGPHNIIIKDEAGNWANVSVYDVMQSNGVIHSIDKVLMPKG